MRGVVVVAGRCLLGLGLIAAALGWAAWTWCSGGRWFPERPYRRRVARPVRAVGQLGLTAVTVGLWLAPMLTGVVLAAGAGTLAGVVAVMRLRRGRASRMRVEVGPVIGNRPARPVGRLPVAFPPPGPPAAGGVAQVRLVGEVEAARVAAGAGSLIEWSKRTEVVWVRVHSGDRGHVDVAGHCGLKLTWSRPGNEAGGGG